LHCKIPLDEETIGPYPEKDTQSNQTVLPEIVV